MWTRAIQISCDTTMEGAGPLVLADWSGAGGITLDGNAPGRRRGREGPRPSRGCGRVCGRVAFRDAVRKPMNDTTKDETRLGRTGDRPHWIRSWSVFIRAAHLLAASAVAGAYLLSVEGTGAHGWWIAAGASGVLLLLAEFLQHRELYREVAGWSTVLKLVIIGMIPVLPAGAFWLMSAAFVVAVLGAHAPRRWRHRRLF